MSAIRNPAGCTSHTRPAINPMPSKPTPAINPMPTKPTPAINPMPSRPTPAINPMPTKPPVDLNPTPIINPMPTTPVTQRPDPIINPMPSNPTAQVPTPVINPAPTRPPVTVNPAPTAPSTAKVAKNVATVLSQGTEAVAARLKDLQRILMTAMMTEDGYNSILAEQSALRNGVNGGDQLRARVVEIRKDLIAASMTPETARRVEAELQMLEAVLKRVQVFEARAEKLEKKKDPSRTEQIEAKVSKTLFEGADAVQLRLTEIRHLMMVGLFTPEGYANILAEKSALGLSLSGVDDIKARISEIKTELKRHMLTNSHTFHPNEDQLRTELAVLEGVAKTYAKMIK
jgi:hypothetical protein